MIFFNRALLASMDSRGMRPAEYGPTPRTASQLSDSFRLRGRCWSVGGGGWSGRGRVFCGFFLRFGPGLIEVSQIRGLWQTRHHSVQCAEVPEAKNEAGQNDQRDDPVACRMGLGKRIKEVALRPRGQFDHAGERGAKGNVNLGPRVHRPAVRIEDRPEI